MTTIDDAKVNSSPTSKEIAQSFFEQLKDKGIAPTEAQFKKITESISKVVDYQPKVGIFGKTGAGKSSLCNALFGKDVAPVSNVKAGTRDVQEIPLILSNGGEGIKLQDVPGVGESVERDVEYSALYETLLPKLDLVVWVLKGDERAFSIDERFYKEVVLPHIKKSGISIVFVINQIDKISPSREWDFNARTPSANQVETIKSKIAHVSEVFDVPPSRIAAVSAEEDYGLIDLVEKLVHCLPDEKKWGLVRETKEEKVSQKVREESQTGLWETVKKAAVAVLIEHAPRLISGAISGAISWFKKFW